MKRVSVACLGFLLCIPLLFLASCASSGKPKPGTAESKSNYAGVRLGRPGPSKGAVEPAKVFLTDDPSIVAAVDFRDLKDPIEVRWDWLNPDDLVYISVSKKAGPSGGLTYPKSAFVHALNVDGEDAATRPGLWSLDVFVDGKLKESIKFNIEPGLTSFRAPRVGPDAKKWAFVVGIERYQNLPPVEFAAMDARKVANYFQYLLGVPGQNVVLLENEKATRSAVTARLKDYLSKNVDPDSVVYVYFAGHGMPDVASGEAYLALYDTEATNISRTGYRVKEYLADIGALNVKSSYVFTDACFSGVASRGEKMLIPGARPAMLHVEDESLATGKVVAMGATTGSQLSHSYSDKRHGLFTFYLLSGLRGQADVDGNGSVTMGELYAYVKENVGRVSRRTAMEQVPSVTPRIENVGESPLLVLPRDGK